MISFSLIPAAVVAILATGVLDPRTVLGPDGFDIRTFRSQVALLSLFSLMVVLTA